MEVVEKDESFHRFRHHEKDPSNLALYDYIMLLKWWCVQDAAERVGESCNIAWIDFGFNHGDAKYLDPKDFDFYWEYDYPEKVNAFCLNDPDKVSLIDSLQFQFDCFTGSFVLPAKLTKLFWGYMKEAMSALVDVGCIDDDQYLMLMVYKKYPDLFHIQIANWFDIFEKNSEHTFEVRRYEVPSVPKRIVNKLKRTAEKLVRSCVKSSFVRRMEQAERLHFG